jgi:hypothetical protein
MSKSAFANGAVDSKLANGFGKRIKRLREELNNN